MPVILNYNLQEQIPHTVTEFPATYYHSVNCFSRQFKKKYGYAPSRYTKMGK